MEQSPRLMYVLAAVFGVLPVVAVALRFFARRRTKVQLLWDDWTIVFSLAACIATAILTIIGAAAGRLAQHSADSEHAIIEDDRYFVFAKTTFGMQLTQTLSIGSTKLSVLLFYLRLFGRPSQTFRAINALMMLFALGWTVSFFFASVFMCNPVNSEIIPDPPDTFTCIDETKMFLAQAYSGVVLDVFILSLPLPMVYRMHCSWTQKLGIFSMFLLGALTTAASITRTLFQSAAIKVYDKQWTEDNASQDITWYLTPMLYWGLIESSLGIVGACLPLYRPLAEIHWIKAVILRNSQHSGVDGSGDDSTTREKSNTKNKIWIRGYHDTGYDESDHSTLEFQTLPQDMRA